MLRKRFRGCPAGCGRAEDGDCVLGDRCRGEAVSPERRASPTAALLTPPWRFSRPRDAAPGQLAFPPRVLLAGQMPHAHVVSLRKQVVNE